MQSRVDLGLRVALVLSVLASSFAWIAFTLYRSTAVVADLNSPQETGRSYLIRIDRKAEGVALELVDTSLLNADVLDGDSLGTLNVLFVHQALLQAPAWLFGGGVISNVVEVDCDSYCFSNDRKQLLRETLASYTGDINVREARAERVLDPATAKSVLAATANSGRPIRTQMHLRNARYSLAIRSAFVMGSGLLAIGALWVLQRRRNTKQVT